jgi:DNA-binding transcriptional ArsR family regulator
VILPIASEGGTAAIVVGIDRLAQRCWRRATQSNNSSCAICLVQLLCWRMTTERHLRASIDQVAAIGHPLRRRLIELLGQDGPATASQLAERTDQLVGNISHHLKMLARSGLVEEVPELAKDRRERWWRGVPISMSWSVADVRGDPVGEVVAAAAEQQNLAHHIDKAQSWFGARDAYDESWTSSAFSTEVWVRATPDEFATLGERINALLVEFRRTHTDDAAGRELCFVFAHGMPARP